MQAGKFGSDDALKCLQQGVFRDVAVEVGVPMRGLNNRGFQEISKALMFDSLLTTCDIWGLRAPRDSFQCFRSEPKMCNKYFEDKKFRGGVRVRV